MPAPLSVPTPLSVQHLYLVWCGTTTNETFKWADLRDELADRAHAKRARELAREEAERAAASGGGEVCGTADGTPSKEGKKQNKKASEKIVVTVPANIYDHGFWRNLCEVLYPLSARPADGFAQALQAGGVMLKFPARPATATSGDHAGGSVGAGAAPEADDDGDSVEYDEDEDDEYIDSDDGRNLPAVAGKMHAD